MLSNTPELLFDCVEIALQYQSVLILSVKTEDEIISVNRQPTITLQSATVAAAVVERIDPAPWPSRCCFMLCRKNLCYHTCCRTCVAVYFLEFITVLSFPLFIPSAPRFGTEQKHLMSMIICCYSLLPPNSSRYVLGRFQPLKTVCCSSPSEIAHTAMAGWRDHKPRWRRSAEVSTQLSCICLALHGVQFSTFRPLRLFVLWQKKLPQDSV